MKPIGPEAPFEYASPNEHLPSKEVIRLSAHDGPVLGVRFNRQGTYCMSCGKVSECQEISKVAEKQTHGVNFNSWHLQILFRIERSNYGTLKKVSVSKHTLDTDMMFAMLR